MNRYEVMMARMAAGERILLDGATGSELEVRGTGKVKHAWTGASAETHPEIISEIHKDYIRIGAEIVISNTFATARHTLSDAGIKEKFEFLNRRGVELVVEAREALKAVKVVVAGGISYWSFADRHPPLDVLAEGTREQAAIMRDAGAEMLMLEMMVDIDRMLTTLEAARTVGLPVWVGFSVKVDDAGDVRLWNGELLSDAIAALDKDVPLINIMHSDVQYIDPALAVAREGWSGPIGVYAHDQVKQEGAHMYDPSLVLAPDAYATCCKGWFERDIQAIGACCGLGPAHLTAVAELL